MSLIQNQFHDLIQAQEILLHFIDTKSTNDENNRDFHDLQSLLNDKILKDNHKLSLFIHLLTTICNNHHQSQDFRGKINQIIHLLEKDETQQLIKEILSIINHSIDEKEEKPEIKILKIVLTDSINELIPLIENSTFSIDSQINFSQTSIQPILRKTNCSLIEFSALCGSIQIFKYLLTKNAKINSQNLWLYSIHGRNNEIIHLIEENKDNLPKTEKDIISLIKEAIKCVHNEIADYIFNNNIKSKSIEIFNELLIESIQSYNFQYIIKITEECKNMNFSSFLHLLCFDGYQSIVEFLCNQPEIDINAQNKNLKSKYYS